MYSRLSSHHAGIVHLKSMIRNCVSIWPGKNPNEHVLPIEDQYGTLELFSAHQTLYWHTVMI